MERLFVHEDWNGVVEDGNDIALLKLTKTTDLRTPDLDAVSSVSKDGVLLAAPGWGLLGEGEGFSDILQVAPELRFVKLSSCNNEGAWNNSIKTSMICAGHGNAGTCQGENPFISLYLCPELSLRSGDSGGPLLMLNRKGAKGWEGGNPSLDLIVGITSFGEGTCDENLPGIFTRVSSFHPWILEKMGDVSLSMFTVYVQKLYANAFTISLIRVNFDVYIGQRLRCTSEVSRTSAVFYST